MAHAVQMLYEPNADGTKTLLVPFRGRIAKVRPLNVLSLIVMIAGRINKCVGLSVAGIRVAQIALNDAASVNT